MEITLEIKGDKAFSIIETLKRIKGVKIKNIAPSDLKYLSDLSQAYKETELSERGKVKLKSFDELVNEI